MPEVLELKPLKNKNLKLILIESEFPIDWWFETPEELKEDLFWNLHLISREYLELVDSLIEKYQPDFAIEERPNSWDKVKNPNDPLKALFKKRGIPFQHADISENAELYLSSALDEHRIMIKKLEKQINNLLKNGEKFIENDEFFKRLVLWKDYLQIDYKTQEDEIRYKVREAWIMMKLLNIGRDLEGTKLKCLLICDLQHFNGFEHLADELGIEVQKVQIKRSIKAEEIEQVIEQDLKIDF